MEGKSIAIAGITTIWGEKRNEETVVAVSPHAVRLQGKPNSDIRGQ